MLEKVEAPAAELAETWFGEFRRAIDARDPAATRALLQEDSHWRNIFGVSWDFATWSGAETVADALCSRAAAFDLREVGLDPETLPPRRTVVAGQDVIEAVFRFETASGPGIGVVRLVAWPAVEARPRLWTISTNLDMAAIAEARADAAPVSHVRDFGPTDWLDRRRDEQAYQGREPDVLVVGGGHAGISAAVELKRLGFDALIVDRMERVGDNWRRRYHGLKLHNKTPGNHMLYMPFPVTWPDYIPKDKIANWLESYVEHMELNFWTRTSFERARYDEATGTWAATVTTADGATRALRPKHIVMATSVSSVPNLPAIPTIERFAGPVVHSSRFPGGEGLAGKPVLVFGSATSAHDISQELHAHGAEVTMVQRSPTLITNVEPSAQLFDGIYYGPGPDLAVRDLLNTATPFPVMKRNHQLLTAESRRLDAPLLERLERVGFRLDFGEDDTGWPLKYRTRGGGYYFNVGCSDLIADRQIGLIQAADIEGFEPGGVRLADGTTVPAELVVLATGYKGQDHMVETLFGPETAKRVGPVWGFNPDTRELRNMWMRTGQPGLWFTGGAFSQCRMYSRYIALGIDAIEAGRLAKAA